MKKLLLLIFSTIILASCGGPATITKEEYKSLEEGMTIDEVKKIVGGDPKEIRDIGDTSVKVYEYDGENGAEERSSVSLHFEGNSLWIFSEYGLLTKREPSDEPVNLEVSRDRKIDDITQSRINENYDGVSIEKIDVNEDAGTGEGYIVLAHLSFDRQNTAGTSKDMISRYAKDLGATLADQTDVNEVTVFFEVPYLKENDNIYKLSMERQGSEMEIVEEFADPNIFK